MHFASEGIRALPGSAKTTASSTASSSRSLSSDILCKRTFVCLDVNSCSRACARYAWRSRVEGKPLVQKVEGCDGAKCQSEASIWPLLRNACVHHVCNDERRIIRIVTADTPLHALCITTFTTKHAIISLTVDKCLSRIYRNPTTQRYYWKAMGKNRKFNYDGYPKTDLTDLTFGMNA